jgi:hypothetical protein
MAKYKAKKSYAKSDDKKNFSSISPAKHFRLLEGLEVEITEVPKAILEHLEEVKIKKKKVKKEDE